MKHLIKFNEGVIGRSDDDFDPPKSKCPSYEEALEKMCKYIADQIYGDYMDGSLNPSYDGQSGCEDTLSILYGVSRKKVRRDVDTIIEEYRTGKR